MGLGTWFRNHPRGLEKAYRGSLWVFQQIKPLIRRIGYARADKLMVKVEYLTKGFLFDCQLCGQCTLHFTGMTCPMTCPKDIRNGPCGGVRLDEGCEVKPQMKCVWVEAYERSQKMAVFGSDIQQIQPPLDRQLTDSSAWINELKRTPALPIETLHRFTQTSQDQPHENQ